MKCFVEIVVVLTFICSHLNAKPLSHLRLRRNAYSDKKWRWPKGIVPYTVDKAFSRLERMVIEEAMKDIEKVSCIQFRNHTNEKGYVQIVKKGGCSADVGYHGKRQTMTLGPGCVYLTTVLHELFHVLGFFHEHTRPDRDDYVIIMKKNIRTGKMHNFKKKSANLVTNLGLPYDYRSILHYHDKSFAKDNSLRSLKTTSDKNSICKDANWLSKLDVLKLNYLYRCSKNKKKVFKKVIRPNWWG